MRRKELLILTLAMLCTAFLGRAQQDRFRWRAGIGVGNHFSNGEMYGANGETSTSAIEFDGDFLAYSASLELLLSQDFGLRAFTVTEPGDFIITNSGLLVTYYTDNDYLFGPKAFLAPYLTAGFATGPVSNTLNIPFGGGIKFRLGSRLNLNVEFVARTYPDQWDSEEGMPDANKAYSSVSLHYNFGMIREAFEAPRPYAIPRYRTRSSTGLTGNNSREGDSENPSSDPALADDPLSQETDSALVIKSLRDTAKLDFDPLPRTSVLDSSFLNSSRSDSSFKARMLSKYSDILEVPQLYDSTRFDDPLDLQGITDTVAAKSPDIGVSTGEDWGFAVVPSSQNTSENVNAPARELASGKRDSVIAYLEYEVKRQRLENELQALQKAGEDSTLQYLLRENRNLENQLLANDRIQALEQRIRQMEFQSVPPAQQTQPSALNPDVNVFNEQPAQPRNFPVTAGVGAGSSGNDVRELADEIDILKNAINNLAEELETERLTTAELPGGNISSAPAKILRDSVVLRYDTVRVYPDSAGEMKVSEAQYDAVQKELQRVSERMDSLLAYQNEQRNLPQAEEPEPKPESFFGTTGKVEIFFDVSSWDLDETSRRKLDDVVSFAEQRTKANFLVKGFTDKTGSASYNKVLANRRAAAVKDYLAEKGIGESRLEVVSLGPDPSLQSGSQRYGRRVEVILN